jgi:hypothetical protein
MSQWTLVIEVPYDLNPDDLIARIEGEDVKVLEVHYENLIAPPTPTSVRTMVMGRI